MKNKLSNTILAAALALFPAVVFAYSFTPDWIIDFIKETHRLVGRIVPVLIGLALLVFVWGVVRFIATDDEKVRADGRNKILWGVVALFVIVSVWGLVALLQTFVGVRGAAVSTPQSYFDDAPLSEGGGGSGAHPCDIDPFGADCAN